jgi:hypothetical protein
MYKILDSLIHLHKPVLIFNQITNLSKQNLRVQHLQHETLLLDHTLTQLVVAEKIMRPWARLISEAP